MSGPRRVMFFLAAPMHRRLRVSHRPLAHVLPPPPSTALSCTSHSQTHASHTLSLSYSARGSCIASSRIVGPAFATLDSYHLLLIKLTARKVCVGLRFRVCQKSPSDNHTYTFTTLQRARADLPTAAITIGATRRARLYSSSCNPENQTTPPPPCTSPRCSLSPRRRERQPSPSNSSRQKPPRYLRHASPNR